MYGTGYVHSTIGTNLSSESFEKMSYRTVPYSTVRRLSCRLTTYPVEASTVPHGTSSNNLVAVDDLQSCCAYVAVRYGTYC